MQKCGNRILCFMLLLCCAIGMGGCSSAKSIPAEDIRSVFPEKICKSVLEEDDGVKIAYAPNVLSTEDINTYIRTLKEKHGYSITKAAEEKGNTTVFEMAKATKLKTTTLSFTVKSDSSVSISYATVYAKGSSK